MGKIPGSSMNYTQVGWEERKELIAKYFQEKGCSNIAVCLPPYQLDIGTKWVKQIRGTGLKVTLLSSEKLKLFDYQAFGQAIALDIIESGSQYDGIYSIYDEITFGIYEVFRKFKIKVPEDVVIMSGGDCDFCHMFSPPIPLFIHDCDELAELAAKDLVKRIEAGDKKTGNEKCVGKVYQKIIETNDTFSNRTIKHEISIIKKEC
jgi:DNA-binding LacI/PurR family transcriptional regulator